ncbi:MAG: hypothetical protein SFY66_29040 [Oculatellaceae cyanobacterium bins.114]|nr:hypothetical protein [Oculatellaceae cyanobacterium bins.114]
MALFKLPRLKFWQRSPASNASGIAPAQPIQPPTPPSPQPIVPQVKSLTALEREMEAEAKRLRVHPTYPMAPKRRPNRLNKLMWLAILVGLPVGVLWVVNLPYPPIRYPVARTAPILLLPSYMSIDSNYRQAIAAVEQAKQFIDNPTSAADLDLGQQKVREAQDRLDALPLDLLNTFPQSRYWWYDWRFSQSGFNNARAEVGRLQAKVLQEQNAQTLLIDSEQAITTAKQQYQQATTPLDKQMAIADWRSALDQFLQIPGQTLAGRTAQQKLQAYQRDFEEIVGLAAGNERASTMIESARQFGSQAAQASQNPPHSVAEWQRVEKLWQDAIQRLEQIPPTDLTGYAESQKLLATYTANLEQIKVRRQAEADSVRVFQQAQQEIELLQASIPNDGNITNINRTISQLQSIINQLNQVQEGTTVYLEAQSLRLSAQNKLNQLQP